MRLKSKRGYCIFAVIALVGMIHATGCSRGPSTKAGKATWRYWHELISAGQSLEQLPENSSPQQQVVALRNMARQIEVLPTLNVDPDAVECGLHLVFVLRQTADFVEATSDPTAIIFESFMRGLLGDPLGTYSDVAGAQSSIGAEWQYLQQYSMETRAALTARYGVEFPPF